MLSGVYLAKRKNGQIYYRCSLHYLSKHISLGSYDNEEDAHLAYLEGSMLLSTPDITIYNYLDHIHLLSFDKAVTLINYREHGIYIKTPIYLSKGFFYYYLSPSCCLKFDNDDLFYYTSHRILKRQGHYYVNDYGMQYNIHNRYGIKNFAVLGRDYTFANGDICDYRYSNIIIINRYHGVSCITKNGKQKYQAKIHLNGDYLIGLYSSEPKAAVAYNKAVDYARDAGICKNFIENYVIEYTAKEYANVYTNIKVSKKYLDYCKSYSATPFL